MKRVAARGQQAAQGTLEGRTAILSAETATEASAALPACQGCGQIDVLASIGEPEVCVDCSH